MDEIQDSTLSAEIDRLHAEHRQYAQRLEELLEKPYLSTEEQIEEIKLKKLKLHAKDLIYTLERRMPVTAYVFRQRGKQAICLSGSHARPPGGGCAFRAAHCRLQRRAAGPYNRWGRWYATDTSTD